MAGVIDALKMPGPLEVKRAVTAAPAEHRRQADIAGFTLNTWTLTHQMLQAKAQGLLVTQLHTMEIIVWRAGNSLPHLIPVTLSIVVGSLPHCQLSRVSAIRDVTVRNTWSQWCLTAVFAECTHTVHLWLTELQINQWKHYISLDCHYWPNVFILQITFNVSLVWCCINKMVLFYLHNI